MYRFAVRASPQVELPAAVWFLLTAGRANKVMLTGAVANALQVCGCQMIQGCAGHPSDSHSSAQAWEFSSAYGNLVGAFLFRFVADGPGEKAAILRFTLGGAAPGVGEVHLASPPDCSPRASRNGWPLLQAAVSGRGRGRVCQALVSEWDVWPRNRSEGRRTGCARLVQGRPVRVSVGGVGGRRFSAMTAEPASWAPWEMATNLVRLEDADARRPPLHTLPQRPTGPLNGGDVTAYSSSDGRPHGLPHVVVAQRGGRTAR